MNNSILDAQWLKFMKMGGGQDVLDEGEHTLPLKYDLMFNLMSYW